MVGYCWGGTVALRAAQVLGLPASSYYGGRNVGFLDHPLKAPAIFHFGADDPSIPPEAIAKQRAAWPDAPCTSTRAAATPSIAMPIRTPTMRRQQNSRSNARWRCSRETWPEHARREDFVLDPRLASDTHVVGDLDFSRVLLMDDARFPWLILVPRRANLRELIDLDAAHQQRLLAEIDLCARVLRALEKPDKLNIAALGNVVAQLHVHVIARQANDAAWPRPVWGFGERVPHASLELHDRLDALRGALDISSA